MTKFILSLGLLLLCSVLYSQEKTILEGRIVADSLDITRINIINVTQGTGTTNTDGGEFSIEVQQGDTLLFSSVQYEDVQIRVTKEHISQKFLEVALSEKTIDLQEVTIRNINLSGSLTQDTKNIETYNYYEGIPTSNIPRLTSIGRKLYTARDGDLDPLLNHLSGRMQMLEKAKKNEQLTMDVQEGLDNIETSFFANELQIPEREIVNFVFYCAESPLYRQLVEDNNYLGLIDLFREKAPDFFELREIEPATGN